MTADEVKQFSQTHAKEMDALAEQMHRQILQPCFDMVLIGAVGVCPIAEYRAQDQFDALTRMGAKLDLVSGCYQKDSQ